MQRTTHPYGSPRDPQAHSGGGGLAGNIAKASLGLGCGCTSLLALVVLVFFGWLSTLPESGAVPGGQLRQATLDHLADHQLLGEGESVVYYYDYSMSMDDSESCFFTDRKVVYQHQGEANVIAWAQVEDLRGWEDWGQIIEVQSSDGRYLKCEIAALNDGEVFFRALQETWERQR